MNIAFILVVLAVFSLIVILRMAVARKPRRLGASIHGQIQPLDIDAFRNLVNPAECEYLRSRLSPREFRRVQRKRLRAAATYIRVAGQNAVFLVRIGQLALGSSDAESVKAARQLINDALLLRRNAMFALLRIRIASIWPRGQFQGGVILEHYQSVDRSAMLLARLQNPAAPVRVSV